MLEIARWHGGIWAFLLKLDTLPDDSGSRQGCLGDSEHQGNHVEVTLVTLSASMSEDEGQLFSEPDQCTRVVGKSLLFANCWVLLSEWGAGRHVWAARCYRDLWDP